MIKKTQGKGCCHGRKVGKDSENMEKSLQQYTHRYNLYLKEKKAIKLLSANRYKLAQMLSCIEKTLQNLWNRFIHPQIRGPTNQKELFKINTNELLDRLNQCQKQKLQRLTKIISEETIEELRNKKRTVCIFYRRRDIAHIVNMLSDCVLANLQASQNQWPISVVMLQQLGFRSGQNTELLISSVNQFIDSLKDRKQYSRFELLDITNRRNTDFHKQPNKDLERGDKTPQLGSSSIYFIPLTLGLLDQICIHYPVLLEQGGYNFRQLRKILEEQTNFQLLIQKKSQLSSQDSHNRNSDMQSSHKINFQRQNYG